jgi:hypothetical protein
VKARLIERLKYSRLSRLAALPLRLRVSLLPLALQAARTLRWLVQSREWANFNGDYEPEGLEAVVCALAELSGRSRAELRAFAQEIHGDAGLHSATTSACARRACATAVTRGCATGDSSSTT